MKRLEGSRWKVVLAARILLLLGAVGLASSASRSFHRSMRLLMSTLPKGVLDLATAAGIIVGVLLIVLSFALVRRNHAAYLLTELLLLVSFILSFLKGLDYIQGLGSLIMFVSLFLIREEFYAKPVRRVITRALLVFGQLILLSFAIGIALILAPDRLFGGEVSLPKMLLTVLHGLVGIAGPVRFISHREQDIFDYSMVLVSSP
jgi:lysyl-tRNA synthetase class 2